jgi:hypothetical protein
MSILFFKLHKLHEESIPVFMMFGFVRVIVFRLGIHGLGNMQRGHYCQAGGIPIVSSNSPRN